MRVINTILNFDEKPNPLRGLSPGRVFDYRGPLTVGTLRKGTDDAPAVVIMLQIDDGRVARIETTVAAFLKCAEAIAINEDRGGPRDTDQLHTR